MNNGADILVTDPIVIGTSTVANIHIDAMSEEAPMLALSGTIGISHATEDTIMNALIPESTNNVDNVKSTETAFGEANSGGAMDHYGITENLTWVSEV